MKKEIVLSGVGGQGLISTGEIIGQAASIFEGLNATMTASYGSETRGTFTKTDVIVSDQQIGYPNVEIPDLILCLAQVAYDKYLPSFRDDTLIVYDTDEVKKADSSKGQHIGYPFRSMGIELGNIQAANTIALGVMMKHTGLLSKENILSAIASRFAGKEKAIAINSKALEKGFEL